MFLFQKYLDKKESNWMKRYLIIFYLFLLTVWGYSQETNLSDIIISTAENLSADEEDPEAVEVFVEKLQELAENPVKINSSSEEEISRLFFLSDFQVKALVEYVRTSGQIVSVYELANIPGFDKESAELIIPFITLEKKLVNNSDSARWGNTMISNFSFKSGKKDTSNLGSAWKILTKYKFTAGRFSGGIVMEKDPGEKLISGSPPQPDFLSAHLAFCGSGLVRKIIVGDYSARFGLGTNINTGLRRGISLIAPGYMSANDEIKPYTSTEENRFFRGLAAEFSLKNLELSVFLSKNYADATIASSDSENDYIENFYLAGVHNTPSLLKKKDAISESACGISISYNLNSLMFGFAWSETRLSLPEKLTEDDPEKIYDFSGYKNNLYTIYYNSFIKKILLYGELSANDNSKLAIVQGMSFRPSDRLTINFLYRNYYPGYTTFYGQGPGTGSKTSNEYGVLGNFTFEAARHLFISGGCDDQHFPWLKYRCTAPSRGIRQELKATFLPSERLSVDASYNYRLSMVNNAESKGIPDQEKLITRSFKISVRYSVHSNLMSGTRFDFKVANPTGSRGMMLFQEICYTFRKIPVSLWVRYCLFNTDDWNSRIYAYENDLLYGYSIPALYGEGSRSYIMVKWKTGRLAELRIKYGITSSVATGKSLENSEEIKMQFRIWF
jgi:Helix-hairpin-helix motif